MEGTAMLNAADRVRLWNSFFYLAWQNAKELFEIQHDCKTSHRFKPKGGMLEDKRRTVLSTVAFSTLAIEARANHIIQKLYEAGRITETESYAAQRLSPEAKWFLLPKLAGRRRALKAGTGPHQAVRQICGLRNDLVHVKFGELSKKLPDAGAMLSWFERLIEAFEDMNVILRETRHQRRRVREITRFKCE